MCEVDTITKIAKTLGVPAGEVTLNSEKVYNYRRLQVFSNEGKLKIKTNHIF